MTIQEIHEEFPKILRQLNTLGHKEVYTNVYTIKVNNRLKRALGRCRKIDKNQFLIEMNGEYLLIENKDVILNTLMHEAIHSLKDCMCHTGKFKVVAAQVNTKYGYNIRRCTKTEKYKSFNKVKFTITCADCGHTYKYYKTNKIVKFIMNNPNSGFYWCSKCGCYELIIKEFN